jgi:hypothetical protein
LLDKLPYLNFYQTAITKILVSAANIVFSSYWI